MMNRTGADNRRRALAAAAAMMCILVAAGCSGDGGKPNASASGDGAGVSKTVTANLAKYSARMDPTYTAPAYSAAAARGKTVWWVPTDTSNPFIAVVGQNLKDALASQGVKLTVCDGKNNPVDANNCIGQAISQQASAIQVDGFLPKVYSQQLASAAAAKIPVFSGAAQDASEPLAEGLTGQSSQAFKLAGMLLSDWVVKHSGGSAKSLFVSVPDVAGAGQELEAYKKEMAQECPGCKVIDKGVTLANWATDIAPTTSAALIGNPSLSYVVPAFDPMTQFTDPAIKQAGKASSVTVATVNGSVQPMQDLKDGSVVGVEIGLDLNALGYIEADLILRALTGQPQPSTFPVAPVRVFDTTNIGELTLSEQAQADGSWYTITPGATKEFFTKLWRG